MKKALIIIAFLFLAVISGHSQDKLSHLRTSKRILTIEVPSAPYYSVQILALKNPPTDASFFNNLDEVKEYPGQDGYVRYCVGSYETYAEANAAIAELRSKGYEEAFVVNTKRFSLQQSNYTYSSTSGKLEINPNKQYVVQLSAFRYPVYLTFFENVKDVYEYRMNDKIFRYTTAPVLGSEVESLLAQIKALGYKKAFIVDYDRYAAFRIE
ncbi:MAG: SPOR domain-containing protein [Marinilabiliaceae bacterium]|nr:SPOR domain-containing protein [Marinilabiliaceae bacterium]